MSRQRKALVVMVALLSLCCLLISLPSAAAAKEKKFSIDCAYCQGKGFPFLCNVTMDSGICFVNSGDMRCTRETGCECCRTASAAGCTLCNTEADWDDYDDDEADI